jgi:hypothetical protein
MALPRGCGCHLSTTVQNSGYVEATLGRRIGDRQSRSAGSRTWRVFALARFRRTVAIVTAGRASCVVLPRSHPPFTPRKPTSTRDNP